MLNTRPIVKNVVSMVVAIGTGKAISSIIENAVKTETVKDKVTNKVAAYTLGGMVGEQASKYTDAKIDAIYDFIEELKAQGNPTAE